MESASNDNAVTTRSLFKRLGKRVPLTFRGQAMLFLIPAIAIISLVFTVASIYSERKILRGEMITKGETIATIAARNAELPVLSENQEQLRRTAQGVEAIKDIAFVAIMDVNSRLLFHSGRPVRPSPVAPDERTGVRFEEKDDFFVFTAPVVTVRAREGLFLFENSETAQVRERIGWVRVGISKEVISNSERDVILRCGALAVIFTIAGSILIYLFMSLATRSLHELISAVKGVRQGEHPEVQVTQPNSEIGLLAAEFNRMSRAVREREEELKDNVQELVQTQSELTHNLHELECQVEAREKAEAELRRHRDHLEELVEQRTAQLTVAKDQAETASRAKSDFLSSMSHELRTPLNAILGYAQILRRQENLTDPQRQQMEIMHSSGQHLLTLINDILDMGKIEAQKMEVEAEPFDLPSLVQQVYNLTKLQAEEKELHFDFEATGELPRYVRGDERKLRQILLNLLSNAVKYTRKGGVLLRAGYDAPGGGAFCCEVVDTGIGIPAEKLEAVFEPFTQLATAGQPRIGTGLGLNITRRLATLMGGTLSVKSEPGKGSVFRLELPLSRIEQRDLPALATTRRIVGYLGERKRVMVVDDTVGNTAMLVALLEPLGFRVDTALSGGEALAKVGDDPPDLVVMDLVMPDVDGLEAVRRLRVSPSWKSVKVIGASATVTKSSDKEAFVAACDAFVEKPIVVDLLLEKVGALLNLRWEYAPDARLDAGASSAPAEPAGPMAVPPKAKLEELYKLARLGDMEEIERWSASLKDAKPEYGEFAATLCELAASFRTKAIVALVEQYRGGEA